MVCAAAILLQTESGIALPIFLVEGPFISINTVLFSKS
jgi:hypothetical protein